MTLTVAETAVIRAAFPALERMHRGHPVAYFDGPGGTQVPTAVAHAMRDYLLHHNANTHWAYPTSVETDAMLLAARGALADFLGGARDEIVFGQNMTSLLFHVSRAIGRTLAPGDEIVITELDHHANVAPWQALVRERGCVLRTVPLDVETGRSDLSALPALLGPKTRVVAVGAASNALGTVTDVAHVARLARATGALCVVDAVHYAPHLLVDVAAIGCDLLLCSAYKFYGPHVGVLWGRRALLASLDVPKLLPASDAPPERLETGTQNHEGIVGAAAAVDWLASLATGDAFAPRRERLRATMATLHARGEALSRQLWDGLGADPRVRRYGPPPGTPRTGTISFTIEGIPSETVARALADQGLWVSHGDFYATTVAARYGRTTDGFVRIGCVAYTTESEVERVVRAVHSLGD
ncbi:MAG: cysteine desulfurase-like protein [Gemmatimonadaceae bacterium]|jgi:cysteine desulfurase family protein (TIGR01976 family)|nr:cysteine desulfurase-like protein [Gemmatimonadaceae bacterium]